MLNARMLLFLHLDQFDVSNKDLYRETNRVPDSLQLAAGVVAVVVLGEGEEGKISFPFYLLCFAYSRSRDRSTAFRHEVLVSSKLPAETRRNNTNKSNNRSSDWQQESLMHLQRTP